MMVMEVCGPLTIGANAADKRPALQVSAALRSA